jgi:2-polyprenyl-3-methyl-5-hydroxy-6-metoxy-1,4-benzoquinol methylase
MPNKHIRAINLGEIPFCIGPMNTPNNPDGIPNTMDFKLKINHNYGTLEQDVGNDLKNLLSTGYRHGVPMGTPSDSSELGDPYVQDFLSYISQKTLKKGKILEIGAGKGFLSKQLKLSGWETTSIEPGSGYSENWDEHNLDVINDFYPSPQITGLFQAIVFYTVLEHISKVEDFLRAIQDQLEENGQIFMAVPNCAVEIQKVDPSMLIHEHISYFTKNSLQRMLNENGLECEVTESKYGRSLFVTATIQKNGNKPKLIYNSDREAGYLKNIEKNLEISRDRIRKIESQGTLGVFCPGRLINILPTDLNYFFFDDSLMLHDKFFPPFLSPIQSRSNIQKLDIKSLIIGSRTFFSSIKDKLPYKPSMKVFGLDDLFS